MANYVISIMGKEQAPFPFFGCWHLSRLGRCLRSERRIVQVEGRAWSVGEASVKKASPAEAPVGEGESYRRHREVTACRSP